MKLEPVKIFHDAGTELISVDVDAPCNFRNMKSRRGYLFSSRNEVASVLVADCINAYILMVEQNRCDINPVKLYVLAELTHDGDKVLTYIVNQEANMSDDIFECVARIRELDYAQWVVGAINEYVFRVQNPQMEEETEEENPDVQYWKNKCKDLQDKLDDANKHRANAGIARNV